jgi:hypothetical protein
MSTLNQAIKALSDFATNHLQINSFGSGDLVNFASSGTTNYPAMYAEPRDIPMQKGSFRQVIRVYMLDRLQKGGVDLIEVLSDRQLVCMDLYAWMNHPNFSWKREDGVSLTLINERFHNDEVAGYWFDLELKDQIDENRCQIPGYSEPSTSPELVVTIYNQAGTLLATVQAPGSYTVTAGGTATVRNSDSSYSTTVNAGDTLVLPDETINVYVNGVLNQTGTYIPLDTTEINITA